MKDFDHILVFHAAAIGDAVLATPVSARLKFAFPKSQITYFTHSSLFPLLKLCNSIDQFHEYQKRESLFSVRQRISQLRPDLIVDLSGSLRSITRTALLAPRVLHYKKQGEKSRSPIHAVDNFLQTIDCLNIPKLASVFPTLTVTTQTIEHCKFLREHPVRAGCTRIAIVPGVGTLRPHRAWSKEHWIELVNSMSSCNTFDIVLVGGQEENALCTEIAQRTNGKCINAANKLSLPETAALLHTCAATISGDTGPSHISVAVGTPVLGIYGPTFPERSGPYGVRNKVLAACDNCRCKLKKHCILSGEGAPGACLNGVHPGEVYESLVELLKQCNQSI